MVVGTLFQDYTRWHYTTALQEIFHIWSNLMWFIVHFFSLPQLTQSWFAPWKRITESRRRAWDIEDALGTFFINTLSRFVGALIRTLFICIGLAALCVGVIGGLLWYTFWILAPIFITALFVGGAGLVIAPFLL